MVAAEQNHASNFEQFLLVNQKDLQYETKRLIAELEKRQWLYLEWYIREETVSAAIELPIWTNHGITWIYHFLVWEKKYFDNLTGKEIPSENLESYLKSLHQKPVHIGKPDETQEIDALFLEPFSPILPERIQKRFGFSRELIPEIYGFGYHSISQELATALTNYAYSIRDKNLAGKIRKEASAYSTLNGEKKDPEATYQDRSSLQ